MTPESFERSLAAFQKRVPFRPFTVELVSGSRFQVEHPEALVRNGSVGVFFGRNGAIVLLDHESVCQVTSEAPSAS